MPRHQRKTKSGTLANIRINGTLHRRHFKHGTDPAVIKRWLLQTELRFRHQAASSRTGRFDDDARVYLEAVSAMTSYQDRKHHIDEWIAVFGKQHRHTITSDQIQAQIEKWKRTPRTIVITKSHTTKAIRTTKRILSPTSINHRRTALQHLFRVLDGKALPNPVKDVAKCRTETPHARGLPYAALDELWLVMRDKPTRARLQVMAYTGMTQKQLTQLTAEHVDHEAKTILFRGRNKGSGTPDTIKPVTEKALLACTAMAKHDCWGPFSSSAMRRDFRNACLRVPSLKPIAHKVRPYDLRHSFGTEVYRVSGDIRATQVLLGHSTPTLTARYAMGAVDERVTKALARFGKAS